MKLLTKAILSQVKDMVLEFSYAKIHQNLQDNGKMIKLMEKGY